MELPKISNYLQSCAITTYREGMILMQRKMKKQALIHMSMPIMHSFLFFPKGVLNPHRHKEYKTENQETSKNFLGFKNPSSAVSVIDEK